MINTLFPLMWCMYINGLSEEQFFQTVQSLCWKKQEPSDIPLTPENKFTESLNFFGNKNRGEGRNLKFGLYANPAGLTETCSHCTTSPRRHRVGLWASVCPVSLGKAIFFNDSNETQPAAWSVTPRAEPSTSTSSSVSTFQQLATFFFGHSCRKLASHCPGFQPRF